MKRTRKAADPRTRRAPAGPPFPARRVLPSEWATLLRERGDAIYR